MREVSKYSGQLLWELGFPTHWAKGLRPYDIKLSIRRSYLTQFGGGPNSGKEGICAWIPVLHIGSKLGTDQVIPTMPVIGRSAGHHVKCDRETRCSRPIGTRTVKGQSRMETNLTRFEYARHLYPPTVTLGKSFCCSV